MGDGRFQFQAKVIQELHFYSLSGPDDGASEGLGAFDAKSTEFAHQAWVCDLTMKARISSTLTTDLAS
jgi:hypothetical protein